MALTEPMSSSLSGKHVVLGVTGSIAAYKAAPLIRQLVKVGAEVQVVMTAAAQEFITPLTLSTLSGRPVMSDFFDRTDGTWHSHVELGLWTDIFLVAPATASTLAKMAYGLADNLLVTCYLATRGRVYVAPAMDLDMYRHPSTTATLDLLRERGATIIEAEEGELASHLVGKGRLAEPQAIVRRIEQDFMTESEGVQTTATPQKPQTSDTARLPLVGTQVLITSGPTYERIDPVRFIGNYSSGRMGKALAERAADLGATVLFVTGPAQVFPSRPGIEIVRVESAEEMLAACRGVDYDVAIFCAAVADYRPAHREEQKVKREKQPSMTLELVSNPDIAAVMGQQKGKGQVHIGFALETKLDPDEVKAKMARKRFDLIVANSLEDEGAGFGTPTNRVHLLSADGTIERVLPMMSKEDVAGEILDLLPQLY